MRKGRLLYAVQGDLCPDLNVLAEDILCPILNLLYGLDLKPLGRVAANVPAVDLGDDKSRIAYQVTSESTPSKVTHTLDTFLKHNLQSRYWRRGGHSRKV